MTQRDLEVSEAFKGFLDRVMRYSLIYVGMITHVDYEKNLMNVMSFDDATGGINIPIQHPSAGAAYIMSMPKKGDFVLYGYRRQNNKSANPIAIAYIPAGFFQQKDFANNLNTRHHYSKLYSGEIALSSDAGSLIRIDRGLRFADAQLREFGLEPDTGRFFMDTDGQTMHLGGVTLLTGAVYRDSVQSSPFYADFEFPMAESGRIIPLITRDNIPLSAVAFDGPQNIRPAFTEFRIEATDTTDLIRLPEELRDTFNDNNVNPIVEFVLGNAIGNRRNTLFYGRPFRLNIFNSTDSIVPQVSDILLDVSPTNDETANIMPAYFMRFPFSGLNTYPTAIAIDKEGQYFAHLAASKKHPNGPGNSAEIATEGRVRLFLGNNPSGISLQARTTGAITAVVGKTVEKGVSIDINASGSMQTVVRADDTGVARYTEIIGDDIEIIHGTKKTHYKSPVSVVYPTKTEEVRGSSSQSIIGGAQATYGDNLDVTVTGTESRRIVKGRATVIATPTTSGAAESLQVLAGNVEESILLGNKTITMTAGNFTETLVAGNRNISVLAGNISVNTAVGNVDIGAAAGNVSITAGLTANITAGVQANVTAPQVLIGGGTLPIPLNAILTTATARCWITGLPYIGTVTAFAGP